MSLTANNGALVISLDFELFWGVRDFLSSNQHYWNNIAGEKKAVSAILDVFENHDISATWATVGFLFSRSAGDWQTQRPRLLPEYTTRELSPYLDDVNKYGRDDSCFFAPDLIDDLKSRPSQEVATHTFSHYYCLEDGQTREAFEADIEMAVKTAKGRGIEIRSIVFPRNQHNPDYDEILVSHGIRCYRGNQQSRMYQFDTPTLNNPYFRATRMLDTFVNVSGHNTIKWSNVWQGKMANVPASVFLRPVSSDATFLARLQMRRIFSGMEYAAQNGQIFHLWWHPHNFGTHLNENLQFLKQIISKFEQLRTKFGFESLSMIGAAEHAAQLV